MGDIIPKVGSPKDYEYLILADGGSFDEGYTELAKVFTDGKVPNLTDGRFIEGGTNARQVKGAGLLNITGSFKICGMGKGGIDDQKGAFSKGGVTYGDVCQRNNGYTDGYEQSGNGDFDASRSNSIYGSSDTVQPKAYTVQYYICYVG